MCRVGAANSSSRTPSGPTGRESSRGLAPSLLLTEMPDKGGAFSGMTD